MLAPRKIICLCITRLYFQLFFPPSRYIYTKHPKTEELSSRPLSLSVQLLKLAHYLGVAPLVRRCEEALARSLETERRRDDVDGCAEVLALAHRYCARRGGGEGGRSAGGSPPPVFPAALEFVAFNLLEVL